MPRRLPGHEDSVRLVEHTKIALKYVNNHQGRYNVPYHEPDDRYV